MMLILLSPAKKLLNNYASYGKPQGATYPHFQTKTAELITLLKSLPIAKIAQLMHLSHELAELNYQRYQLFCLDNCPLSQLCPAVFLFRGDVYGTLNADLWGKDALDFAQSHLLILSGLYGLLKPLDLIQPYRLEMGTKLENSAGKNLYTFWRTMITQELNRRLTLDGSGVLINLASTEYFNAVDVSQLQAPVLTIHFKEKQGNQLKIIGIHAKKARGAMANYIIQHQIKDVEKIKEFSLLGYHYCETSSNAHEFNFIRS